MISVLPQSIMSITAPLLTQDNIGHRKFYCNVANGTKSVMCGRLDVLSLNFIQEIYCLIRMRIINILQWLLKIQELFLNGWSNHVRMILGKYFTQMEKSKITSLESMLVKDKTLFSWRLLIKFFNTIKSLETFLWSALKSIPIKEFLANKPWKILILITTNFEM